MSKLPLPVSFSEGMFKYDLIYIPALPADADPRYAMEPNTATMRAVSANSREVTVPNVGKQMLTWVLMEQPARPGSAVPARLYRFFRLSKNRIPIELLRPGDCICYALTPLHMQNDPEQAFVNCLFGYNAEPKVERENWVSSIFAAPGPQEEEQKQEAGVSGPPSPQPRTQSQPQEGGDEL